MSNSGLGTSSQTFGAGGASSQASQTNPYAPAQEPLSNLLGITNNLLQNGGQGGVGPYLSAS